MAKNAIVSEEMAKKFATEKDTPYLAGSAARASTCIDALYVKNLNTVELKPWARREGKGVYLNHDASRAPPTTATSARSRRARSSRRSACCSRR